MQKRTAFITIGLLVSSMCYFAFDVVVELFEHVGGHKGYTNGQLIHLVFEVSAVIGLFCGIFLAISYVKLLQRKTQQDMKTINAFRGKFDDIITAQFDAWALTDAERDVAQFTLKGLTLAEISDLRNTSVGTVKAQTNAIFTKSGLKSRTDFLSYFLEEFLDVETHSVTA